MDNKTIEILERLDKRTERLEVAIVGDPAMGNKGVIKRIEDLEKDQKTSEKKMIIFGAAGTGAIFGFKGLWDKIINLF